MYKNHVIDNVLIAHHNDTLKGARKSEGGQDPTNPLNCEKCGIEFGIFTIAKLCRLCGYVSRF